MRVAWPLATFKPTASSPPIECRSTPHPYRLRAVARGLGAGGSPLDESLCFQSWRRWNARSSNGMDGMFPSISPEARLTFIPRDPKLIVDAEGRIIAILLGQPDDPEWADVILKASKALARARREAVRRGVWRRGDSHCRGGHFSVADGTSFGGGQRVGGDCSLSVYYTTHRRRQRPGNLRQSCHTRAILLKLRRNRAIRRIIGFQSCM